MRTKRSLWAPAFAGVTALLLASPSLFAETAKQAKESYVAKAESELKEWNEKIEQVQKRTQEAGSKTRTEVDRQLDSLKDKAETVRQNLEQLKASGETGWKKLRRHTDQAFRDLKHAYRGTKEKLP